MKIIKNQNGQEERPQSENVVKQLGKINLVTKNVNDLKPAEYNPRTMTERARQGLSNSIDTFGLVQPIVWNKRTGNVVGGHQRLFDIVGKGVTEVDVIEVDLSDVKEKALNISLNNNAIAGDFTDGLQELLSELEDDLKVELMLEDLEIVNDLDELPEVKLEGEKPEENEYLIITFESKDEYEIALEKLGVKAGGRSVTFNQVREVWGIV